MTQQEFEKRTGHRLTVEEYAAVEREYMELPDELDIFKDQFCRLWLDAGCGKTGTHVANYLLKEYYKENKNLRKELEFHKWALISLSKELKTLKGGSV